VTPGPGGGDVVGVGVTGVGIGVGWDVGVGVAFGFNAGADVGFDFGNGVGVNAGKVLIIVGWIPLPLATEFCEGPKPITRGSKTIIVIITVQRAAIIDHFHTRRREPEDARSVPFEASYGGVGGVAWYGNPFELPNCEI
jgi:hypothetical protein